jgi:hypothetical protein
MFEVNYKWTEGKIQKSINSALSLIEKYLVASAVQLGLITILERSPGLQILVAILSATTVGLFLAIFSRAAVL